MQHSSLPQGHLSRQIAIPLYLTMCSEEVGDFANYSQPYTTNLGSTIPPFGPFPAHAEQSVHVEGSLLISSDLWRPLQSLLDNLDSGSRPISDGFLRRIPIIPSYWKHELESMHGLLWRTIKWLDPKTIERCTRRDRRTPYGLRTPLGCTRRFRRGSWRMEQTLQDRMGTEGMDGLR